ncbi:MAG: class I SAM-dependent methyltransferase [Cellvibrionaceae bacterium]
MIKKQSPKTATLINKAKHTSKLLPLLAIVSIILTSLSWSPILHSDTRTITEALKSPSRMAGDSDRDAARKPAQVLAFLGLKPGMTVLDVMASGGWYTEVLSLAVGEKGKVYAQNSPAFLQFRDGMYEKAISKRLEGGRLNNVTRINADFDKLGIDNSVDIAITALNFHDIYNRSPEAGIALLKDIKKSLKPGGVFGLIDHNGAAGADNASIHRMPVQDAVDAAKAAGFIVETSALLASKDDDLKGMVFSPELRGKTDRFLIKMTKPK